MRYFLNLSIDSVKNNKLGHTIDYAFVADSFEFKSLIISNQLVEILEDVIL